MCFVLVLDTYCVLLLLVDIPCLASSEMTTENGQEEQKPEKFSLRKELKRKRQEHQNSSNDPEKERDIPKHEMKPRPILPAPSPNYFNAGINFCFFSDMITLCICLFEWMMCSYIHIYLLLYCCILS